MPVATQESEGHVASSSAQKSPTHKNLRNRILCRVTCIDGTVLTAELQVSINELLSAFEFSVHKGFKVLDYKESAIA